MKDVIEKGAVILFDKKFWLFAGYGKNCNNETTYRLHGLEGEVDEVEADKCRVILSPNEI